MKSSLKAQAISLRQTGYSYNEILYHVPVAKSTLSLWLRSVGLSKRQKQRITTKRLRAAHKGGSVRKRQRLSSTAGIIKSANREIQAISKQTLLMIGAALYWAEGSKQKDYYPSCGVIFTNSDPRMIKIFLRWLNTCLGIPNKRITCEIHIHEKSLATQQLVKIYWARTTGFPENKFDKIYLKRDTGRSKRRNRGNGYYGQLRVKVQRSTDLNRKISGWIEGICQQCGVV